MTIDRTIAAQLRRLQDLVVAMPRLPFGPVDLPAGVVPPKIKLAMDEGWAPSIGYLNTAFSGQGFPGYAFLSELTQRAEYRNMSERIAYEMTRKWIRLKSASDQDKADEIKIIDKKLKEFRVRHLFRSAATHDGFFGRGQLYIKIQGANRTQTELQSQLIMSRFKIAKGALRGFKLVEPIITFPYEYNSSDALRDDYYVPRSWFVLGQRVHDTRMLTFISRPVPDLLKPAYNFGGMSMSQLAIDTVNNWLRTRDGVNRMINSYSTSGIRTKMADVLAGGDGADFLERLELFTAARDNQGLMVLDKDTEEFFQFTSSLSELSKLQAQAQEHMASICHVPLIVLLGISPSGLNATAEPELRTFYDYVHDMQEAIFREPLEKVIKLIQISEFQSIDEDITFDFEPLWQADVEKLARIRKADADAAVERIAAGVISATEERSRLAKDPDSGYEGLDTNEEVPAPNPALVQGKDPLLAKTEGLEQSSGGWQ